jgi:hypothetical protein
LEISNHSLQRRRRKMKLLMPTETVGEAGEATSIKQDEEEDYVT